MKMNKAEFRNAIQETSAVTGFSPALVEKDYRCSVILKKIYENDFLKENLIFKGGTLLAKCYLTFFRMSEDLDWQVTDGYGGKMTKALIEDACRRATSSKYNTLPNVIVDRGTENLNRHVDQLIQSGIIKRTIAQLDISFSNSMIESFFRTIKHRWLFMLSLDDLASVRKHVGVFIEDYNTLIPHSALRGATPLEMYLGLWLPAQMDELQHAEEQAREERRIANLSSACGVCPT